MKVRDIVEYGMTDEPAPGVSKARVRQDAVTPINQTRRANAQNANAGAEQAIAQQQANISQKRKRVAPTGIPSRLLSPQPPQEEQQ